MLGSLRGQIHGAYQVKVGNRLSRRREGARHVEIVQNLGSKAESKAASWIIFEATSDPGFFARAQQGLEKLRDLKGAQQEQREDTARQPLLRTPRRRRTISGSLPPWDGSQHRFSLSTPTAGDARWI